MEFEWDDDKRQLLIAERDVDLMRMARIFEGPVLTEIDDRRDYGETRWVSLGMLRGEAFYVVHTDRNGVRRLITAWKAGESGKRKYQAGIAGRNPPNG